jgi:molybdate-binding protein
LLEWALRESRSALATLPEGSESGLARFRSGELLAAAIHLHDLGDAALDANVEAMRSPGLDDAVLIAFARREQGFIVAPGNPLGIATINDITEKRARMAMRPAGAGAQLLLRALLHRAKLAIEHVNAVTPPAPTGSDIALAVRAKRADCGIATRSVANATGLDFVPIVWERFDLMIRHRDYFRPPVQAFYAFLRTEEFAARAAEQGGYDISETGSVRFTR